MATEMLFTDPDGDGTGDWSTDAATPIGDLATRSYVDNIAASLILALAGKASLPIATSNVTGLDAALAAQTAAIATFQTSIDNSVTTEVLGETLSDALAGYVTSSSLTAILATIPYWHFYNGTAWPGSRPSGAGTRTVIAAGGPAAPTWLNTTYHDVWLGTIA